MLDVLGNGKTPSSEDIIKAQEELKAMYAKSILSPEEQAQMDAKLAERMAQQPTVVPLKVAVWTTVLVAAMIGLTAFAIGRGTAYSAKPKSDALDPRYATLGMIQALDAAAWNSDSNITARLTFAERRLQAAVQIIVEHENRLNTLSNMTFKVEKKSRW